MCNVHVRTTTRTITCVICGALTHYNSCSTSLPATTSSPSQRLCRRLCSRKEKEREKKKPNTNQSAGKRKSNSLTYAPPSHASTPATSRVAPTIKSPQASGAQGESASCASPLTSSRTQRPALARLALSRVADHQALPSQTEQANIQQGPNLNRPALCRSSNTIGDATVADLGDEDKTRVDNIIDVSLRVCDTIGIVTKMQDERQNVILPALSSLSNSQSIVLDHYGRVNTTLLEQEATIKGHDYAFDTFDEKINNLVQTIATLERRLNDLENNKCRCVCTNRDNDGISQAAHTPNYPPSHIDIDKPSTPVENSVLNSDGLSANIRLSDSSSKTEVPIEVLPRSEWQTVESRKARKRSNVKRKAQEPIQTESGSPCENSPHSRRKQLLSSVLHLAGESSSSHPERHDECANRVNELIITGIVDCQKAQARPEDIALTVLCTVLPSLSKDDILSAKELAASTLRSTTFCNDRSDKPRINDNRPPSILVKVASSDIYNKILDEKQTFTRFHTSDIDLTRLDQNTAKHLVPTNIYINEALTSRRFKHFMFIKNKAKALGFKFVWHRRGRILARLRQKSKVITVNNEDDLIRFRNNQRNKCNNTNTTNQHLHTSQPVSDKQKASKGTSKTDKI